MHTLAINTHTQENSLLPAKHCPLWILAEPSISHSFYMQYKSSVIPTRHVFHPLCLHIHRFRTHLVMVKQPMLRFPCHMPPSIISQQFMDLYLNPLLAWNFRHGEQQFGQELCFGDFCTFIVKHEDTWINGRYKLLSNQYIQDFVEMDMNITVEFG